MVEFGGIDADRIDQILVGKRLTRSIRFTCILWKKRTIIIIEDMIMNMYTVILQNSIEDSIEYRANVTDYPKNAK